MKRRCKAKVSDGSRRCRLPAIKGGVVCHKHGGGAPQVKRTARQRLQALAEPAVDALRLALDKGDMAETIKAARLVLDRTGHGPRSSIEVETEPPPGYDLTELSTETKRRIVYELEHGEPWPGDVPDDDGDREPERVTL